MKNKTKQYSLIIFLLLFSEIISAGESQILTFSQSELKITQKAEFNIVNYGNFDLSQIVGNPQLPFKMFRLLLNPGQEIDNVSIEILESEFLDGEHMLAPAQAPQILSDPNIRKTLPKSNVYSSPLPYPQNIVTINKQGYFSGQNIGTLQIFPLQFFPLEKKLLFISKLKIEIFYKNISKHPRQFSHSEYSAGILDNCLQDVKNITEKNLKKTIITNQSELPDEIHRYIIITSADYSADFQPLCEWKNKKGLSAKIITTEWIYSNYTGIDEAEQLRNFIIDAYQSWETLWIVLGGDTEIVPMRKAFAFDCEYGDYGHNYIPCDLYYSDLDGDWNSNGNEIFGETDDEIDMYPDIFVGRISAKNSNEIQAYVNKLLVYEKNPPNGHELNMLFLAQVLWDNPYTNSGLSKNLIDDLYVPDTFDPITKLYEDLGNENAAAAIEAINAGQNIINHDGHAWYSVMGVGENSLHRSEIDDLQNESQYSILYSIGCWPAAFDYDCIAEHFILNPQGGGVAFIGNSRYGWGSPGNPLYGYSDRFDQQFFKHLFVNDITNIGMTMAAAKSFYVPLAQQENVYRWCIYEINLLGDPEMMIRTDTPSQITATFPHELSAGENSFSIIVSHDDQVIVDAMVCLCQKNGIYETAITGNNGEADFSFVIDDISQPIDLTITAKNRIPFQDQITLFAEGAHIGILSYSSDVMISPADENIPIDITCKNFGNESAASLSATCSSENPQVTLQVGERTFGDIAAGDSLTQCGAFVFHLNSSVINGENIFFDITFSDNQGNEWTDHIVLTAKSSVVKYRTYTINDSEFGNSNGFAEKGEKINGTILLENLGSAETGDFSINIESDDPDLQILNSQVNIENIMPSDSAGISFLTQISQDCPEPYFPKIILSSPSDLFPAFQDTFLLSVGKFGFFDNVESDSISWTHSGSIDLWHRTTNRSHSDNFSWYCGNEDTFVFDNNMESNVLESSAIIIGQEPELSFWCWYQFPNYGTNGIYPEISDGNGWHTLDFIGSGGALAPLPTGNDWLEYTYTIDEYSPGSEVKLRFRFQSDSEIVTEGVYIDDIRINSMEDSFPAIIAQKEDLPTEYLLFQNYPNPFNPNTTISFYLPKYKKVMINIYNVRGQLIETLINENKAAGTYHISWNAEKYSSGVYFYHFETDEFSEVKKCLLLK